jgi:hypothetical protein
VSTTLANARIALKKDVGDYYSGTTTGAGSTTTVVDTSLCAYANDFITDYSWILVTDMTGDTYNDYERKVSSLDNTTGTLTVLAIGGALGTSATYELSRFFSSSDYRTELIQACQDVYPSLYKQIWDESIVSGNWLKDGSFEKWSSTSALSYWTTTTSTLTQTSTNGLFKRGTYSAKLTVAAGSISQTITNNDDLKNLAGQTVTFTVQGKCATASCLRIGISDGTTTTYSDYLDQTTGWTEDDDPLTVTATIADNPSAVTFYIYHDVATGTSYVDDARVICGNPRIYIGHLGLHRNTPHSIEVGWGDSWVKIRGYQVDSVNGYLYLPEGIGTDVRLRIRGIGLLDFLASGVSSTAWTATVDVDVPQLSILTAQAAVNLYRKMSLPNYTTGDTTRYQQAMGFWTQELENRKSKFSMPPIGATINWMV